MTENTARTVVEFGTMLIITITYSSFNNQNNLVT